MTLDQPVPEEMTVDVPVGGRVLVVSDLLLEDHATRASTSAAGRLAETIEAWEGPGVLVLAGNVFNLLGTGQVDPSAALAAHPRLAAALSSFARRPERRVVFLPGSRDGRVAWDAAAAGVVGDTLGAEVALACRLDVATGTGTRWVRVEPGQRLDPRFAAADARDPAETPLGHHLVTEVLPALGMGPDSRKSGWLTGADRLTNYDALPRFLVSRLLYRRLPRHLWWALLPLVGVVGAELLLGYALPAVGPPRHPAPWSLQVWVFALVAAVLTLVLVALGTLPLGRRVWARVRGAAFGEPALAENERARNEARALVTAGWHGLVTGHTLHPELTPLGEGFYANCGGACEVVEECPAHLGLPPVFGHHRQVSWVELEAGADLHVHLLEGRMDLPGASLLERLVARRRSPAGGSPGRAAIGDGRPEVVATFPGTRSWPPAPDPERRHLRVRRTGAAVVALAGLVDLLSAVTPPLRAHLRFLHGIVPLVASEAAAAFVALAGLALLALARGIRRGQRQAWAAALVLLGGSAILNLVKGADLLEAALAGAVALLLVTKRGSFQARVDRPSRRWGVTALMVGVTGTILVTTAAVEVTLHLDPDHGPLGVFQALQAVAGRLVGVQTVPLPARTNEFVSPVLLAIGLGLAAAALFLISRPVAHRRRGHARHPDQDRARDIVARHGRGTLDYFALRDDKAWFFEGDSLVAYAVWGGVCLVSPDPIGPVAERDLIWGAFRRFADRKGWSIAVLGASEAWLPTYRRAGMHDLYVGDEGVVDLEGFSLEGGRNKGLRQAVNRIARHGYTMSYHDPADLEPDLAQGLRRVMEESRRGEGERGFSMTLGRAFDPQDRGLLLAVAHDPTGAPVAFCQYVPAPGIDGYSLDLMRRDRGDHPNGLIDFVVVSTIGYLRDQGFAGLGLNFATMRAVLAGEAGDGLPQRIERWVLRRMSGSMQIESLWRFNAKYDPTWQPRFTIVETPEQAPAAAMAIARAESFWELPLIGRFLVPGGAEVATRDPADGHTPDGDGKPPEAAADLPAGRR